MLWLVLLGAFFTAVFLLSALLMLFSSPRREILERIEAEPGDPRFSGPEGAAGGRPRLSLLFRVFGGVGRVIPRRSAYLTRLQKKLLQARFYMRAEELIGLSTLFGLAFFLVAMQNTGSFLVAILLGVIGYRIPGIALEVQRRRIKQKLEKQIVPALSTIAGGLRAGYSFAQALEVVYHDALPPLAEEIGRVLRDNRLGRPLFEALKEMVERTESNELDLVISTLDIQRETGGNMADLIDKIENTMREREALQEEIRALTSQQRFSALLIFLLPLGLALLISLLNPGYLLPLVEEPVGRVLLGIGLAAQLVGFLLIRRFMKIEV